MSDSSEVPKNADSMSGQFHIPALNRSGCTSYAAGHGVHWIQALGSMNKPAASRQSWRGQIVAIDGGVLMVRRPDGTVTRFRNHDPARLVAIVERDGVGVLVNDQYAVLRHGSFCFSVQSANEGPLGACLTAQLAPKVEAVDLAVVRTREVADGRQLGTPIKEAVERDVGLAHDELGEGDPRVRPDNIPERSLVWLPSEVRIDADVDGAGQIPRTW